MSQKELTVRLALIIVVITIAFIFGLFAMRCYIDDLNATIAAKDAEIKALEEKNAELQVIVDEVEAAETAIRAVNPDAPADEIHTLAVRQVGKS